MPSRTAVANKSSLFAVTGSTELGGGQDDHLPVGGPWSGYTFRSALSAPIDWSGMKTITSARLRLKTSSQVHIGFSSAPDYYVARATASWTANSGRSSADSGGGGGWSTAATNYPGPPTTTASRVSKRAPTSESTYVEVDITGIVLAWAPATIPGGSGLANYGVVLYGVASGDITEFISAEGGSGNRPEIIIEYTTDQPPVATMTGPTGVQGTTRPTLTGTGTDPDGDAIEGYHLTVYKAGSPVYTYDTGPVGGSFSHVPTADLPGGALTADAYVQAGGLVSPASNQVSFTVDRPPVVGAFSAPPASTSSRRPPITWATSDPDGDAINMWDLEVYATSGGAPTGSPVYQVLGQVGGITAGQVTHTPTADLPGGNLVARARVRSGPAALWSDWSGYHPFLIALNAPTIAWVYPVANCAYVRAQDTLYDSATALGAVKSYHQIRLTPPSGQTITRLRVWAANGSTDPSLVPANLVYDGAVGVPNAASDQFWAHTAMTSGVWSSSWEATASGGGVTKVWRTGRVSFLEWVGRAYLGDSVTSLTASLVGKATQAAGWIRAENDAGAATGPWRTTSAADTALVQGELPATAAWLGLRARAVHQAQDVDLLGGAGSFEDSTLAGWVGKQGLVDSIPFGGAPDGSRCLRIRGDGTTSYPQIQYIVPVVPGGKYTMTGSLRLLNGPEVDVRADAFSGGTEVQSFAMRLLKNTTGSPFVQSSASYVVPANVDNLHVLIYLAAAPSAAGQECEVDALTIVGPAVGASGLDRWDLAWRSAG